MMPKVKIAHLGRSTDPGGQDHHADANGPDYLQEMEAEGRGSKVQQI